MAIVVLNEGKFLAKADFEDSRKDYNSYIKITADIRKGAVVLGGE